MNELLEVIAVLDKRAGGVAATIVDAEGGAPQPMLTQLDRLVWDRDNRMRAVFRLLGVFDVLQ